MIDFCGTMRGGDILLQAGQLLRLLVRRALRACFEIQRRRRVRARGLQELAKIANSCRPGPLIGRISKRVLVWSISGILTLAGLSVESQDAAPPSLVFNAIAIELEPSGQHRLNPAEIQRMAEGSSDAAGITNLSVAPDNFSFCDVGTQTVVLTLSDRFGNTTNRAGPIEVRPPAAAPRLVHVDAAYPSQCTRVGFPSGRPDSVHFIGFDAFNTIQAAVNQVAESGIVFVAAGTYTENVVISKPLLLMGPNAGRPGNSAPRLPEARVIPARSDPENTPIIAVESDDVTIDGLFLDGSNPGLTGGYNANGVRVHAAAGIQNGIYPDLADIAGIAIHNCVITNISYDGICLDRYQYFGTSSGWNYIRDNKLANMWEGILTYALDPVIANNVITNVTHGLGVHCVDSAAPKGFQPLVASNTLTIAQWWPVEIDAARAPGIWINYRRGTASPIAVVGNVVNTPAASGPLKTIIGLYALTVDGKGKVDFIDNTVNGAGNCNLGVLAVNCWSNSSVRVLHCSLNDIRDTGVLADTLDQKWGPGNCFVTVSNTAISLKADGFGVVALQEEATPACTSSVEVVSNCYISGGACGVDIRGTNAFGSVRFNAGSISRNRVGIHVGGGRALIEGNALTNNSLAALWVENDGLVDAGDCSGANITGLGSGSGLHGASAGLNDLSGYGISTSAPWAITNSGSLPVMADRNTFNSTAGEILEDAIAGPVSFSSSGILALAPPPPLEVECIGHVPLAASTVEEFVSSGGAITAVSDVTMASRDLVVTNNPGQYTVTRRYTFSGGCGAALSCSQTITARDNQAPTLHCSDNIVRAVDPGCDYAIVTFTNLAADSCGELLGPWVPVSSGRFAIGTNTVIVVATDLAGNSSACSFDVAVVGPPVITLNPMSRTNNPGTTASFKVSAASPAPVTFQWKKNGLALADGGRISGSTNAQLTLAAVTEYDAADYSVDVNNFAGTTSSATAHLTVPTRPGNLRITELTADHVRLAVDGAAGNNFCLLTSTNLNQWSGLQTNRVPFTFTHSNLTGFGCRFYRAVPER